MTQNQKPPEPAKTGLLSAPVEYAMDAVVNGTWKPEFKPFGLAMGPQASDMIICKATPEQKAKLDEIKKDLLSKKIKVLDS